MRNLDRFLLTPMGRIALQNRTVYQLLAITSLYTTIKINEPEAINPSTVSSLSRGSYSAKQVEMMERTLLETLEWRVNPVTSMAFVRAILDVIPDTCLPADERKAVLELCKIQTELAAKDYKLILVKPSVMAYSSLTNALESLPRPSQRVLSHMEQVMSRILKINQSDVVRMKDYLLTAVVEKEPTRRSTKTRRQCQSQTPATPSFKQPRRESCSPRSVAAR